MAGRKAQGAIAGTRSRASLSGDHANALEPGQAATWAASTNRATSLAHPLCKGREAGGPAEHFDSRHRSPRPWLASKEGALLLSSHPGTPEAPDRSKGHPSAFQAAKRSLAIFVTSPSKPSLSESASREKSAPCTRSCEEPSHRNFASTMTSMTFGSVVSASGSRT